MFQVSVRARPRVRVRCIVRGSVITRVRCLVRARVRVRCPVRARVRVRCLVRARVRVRCLVRARVRVSCLVRGGGAGSESKDYHGDGVRSERRDHPQSRDQRARADLQGLGLGLQVRGR